MENRWISDTRHSQHTKPQFTVQDPPFRNNEWVKDTKFKHISKFWWHFCTLIFLSLINWRFYRSTSVLKKNIQEVMLQCMAKFQKKVEPLPTKRYSTIIRFIAILKQSNNQMVLGQLPQKKTNPNPNPNLGTIIFEGSCPDT